MNKAGKWILITIGSIAACIGIMIVIFIIDMTPDSSEEEKVKEKAADYLEETYSGQMEIFDTLYDNMGNFAGFEYAAKVTNNDNDVSFLVYEDRSTGRMVDDYAVRYYEDQLYDMIIDDIEQRFTPIGMVTVSYDEGIDRKFQGEVDLPEIRELEASPSIIVWLDREAEEGDQRRVDELMDILKNDLEIPHAGLKVDDQSFEKDNIIEEY
ncbi:hypothetical protein [Halobacillus kuroshimensis]|uniref:hypothetical protein n=1 Tax=Halobacillus kuroshimensis TaxID=302481 RepID=UPI000413C3AB|nr:hypothetical protein [Halobacillus kuroshimensis]